MKLVEILAKELVEWPDNDAAALVQDSDSYVCGVSKLEMERIFFKGESWHANAANYYLSKHELVTDHATAIVTRKMWQAERDRIQAWRFTGLRISLDGSEIKKAFDECMQKIGDDPRTTRDRIREIDANIEAMTAERAELVSKLAGEGFALIAVAAETEEDMSDWRNWKAGDCIEFVGGDGAHKSEPFTVGKKYTVHCLRPDSCNSVHVKLDDNSERNGWRAEYFKFHSRPNS